MRSTRRRSRPRSALVVLGLGVALALGAAACGGSPEGDGVATLGGDRQTGNGGGGSGGNGTATKDPQEAALEFAKCMREHGVDMPDPEVDSQGRVRITVGGAGGKGRPDPKKLEAAQQACGHLMRGGGEGPGTLDPKAQDAMLAFARCMREHGIDMPDPTGDGLTLSSRPGQGPDPRSAKFKEAERACDHHLADLGRGERSTQEQP
jgi:hypothetical protein